MRNAFKGFYTHGDHTVEKTWKSTDTLFVFDANVLLNLYGYAEQTQNDFFKLLKTLNTKIWIPYQAGLEYQNQRLSVIKNEKAIFRRINEFLENIEAPFSKNLPELALQTRLPELHKKTETLQKEINAAVKKYKKSVKHWDNKQPCVRSHDEIRDQIDELFEDKIGPKPKNQEWLNGIYSEGQERYKNKTPPGFQDKSKAKSDKPNFTYDGLFYEKQYGDLIVWKQIIEKARSSKIKNVIFVSDDSKEDWWYIVDSGGKKTIGPHADLQSEIYREAEIDLFHMYNTSEFLEKGKEILEISVHASSISDASSYFEKSIERERQKSRTPRATDKLNDVLRDLDKYKELIDPPDTWDRFFKKQNDFERATGDLEKIYRQQSLWDDFFEKSAQKDLFKHLSTRDIISIINTLNLKSDDDNDGHDENK